MTFLLLSMALVALTLLVVRPVMAAGARLSLANSSGIAVVGAFGVAVPVALLFGIEFALALLAAWQLKELGHALGYRLAGHPEARLRLMPLPGCEKPTERTPESDLAALFVALMGPGLSLAPMVVAFALGEALATSAPALAHGARSFALAAGGLNFLALLPLWPLDGGRLMQLIVEARFPRVSGLSAAALAAFLVGLSVTLHSALLFLLALVGALALVRRPRRRPGRPRLTPAQVRIGFAAYFASLSAFFLGGWWVLRVLPLAV